ncbi:hypothetical protein NED98_18035 [Sphingomonas sp. MMSM20]|nr:hypothetical protein [Sphingomonas lycopersici]MCW6532152.1 hypothetical protein [Sphingomonas lycopersici]
MANDREDRAARLAEQLRANLRKRKAQARSRPDAEAAAPDDSPAKA